MVYTGSYRWPTITVTCLCTVALVLYSFTYFVPYRSIGRLSAHGKRFKVSRADTLGASFIIGTTTVSRHNASYLNSTLHSLQCALATDNAQPTVLVLNGDIPPKRHTEFETLWKQPQMQHFMRQGLTLIQLGELHQQLQAAQAAGGLPQTHGDPPERVWWRSKENLDKAYLIEAALNVSQGEEYYIQLEDDVKMAPNFLSKLNDFIHKLKKEGKPVDLVSLFGDGGHRGGVTIVYKLEFLRDYVAFLRTNFFQSPYDWLLDGFVRQHGLSVQVVVPNLAQHTGVLSSLKGKVQLIVSTSFEDSNTC